MINLIVMVDRNWGIGKDGGLLYFIEQDKEFFKNMTIGKTIVMGRKTFESLPGKKPLGDRVNIVLTNDIDFKSDGVTVCHSAEEVLRESGKYPEVFIIGGEEIYSLFLPYCDRAYVTKVDAIREADRHMVNLDKSSDWQIVSETKDFVHGEFTYRFSVYERQ